MFNTCDKNICFTDTKFLSVNWLSRTVVIHQIVAADAIIREYFTKNGIKNRGKKMNTNYISKIFSGAVFSSIVLLVLFGISASNVMAQTGARITVKKDVCDSINASNACNGNNTSLRDRTIRFTVQDLSTGAFLDPIDVTINLGGGSNGQTTSDGFTAGTQVMVCEVVPAGFKATPQPESSTNGNQTSSGNCIIATLGPGSNQLQFANSPSLGPTAATAMIAGRVTVDTGFVRGNGKLLVTILNTRTLETQMAFTNRLGYYEFNDLSVGDTYVLNVRGKGYSFIPQTFTLVEDSAMDILGMTVSRSGSKGPKGNF